EDDGGERARYVPDGVADVLAGQVEQVALSRGAVDFAGSSTNAVDGAGAAADARPLPVLLPPPGCDQCRRQGTADVEEQARQGCAGAAVDHPHETSAVEFPDGRVVRDSVPGGDAPTLRSALRTRVADLRLVLDAVTELAGGGNPDAGGRTLPEGLGEALDPERAGGFGPSAGGRTLPEGLGEALDPERVGVFGHSAGGLAAAEVMLDDDRVDAGADLDGSIAYHIGDEDWAEAALRGVDRPFLLFGAGRSGPE